MQERKPAGVESPNHGTNDGTQVVSVGPVGSNQVSGMPPMNRRQRRQFAKLQELALRRALKRVHEGRVREAVARAESLASTASVPEGVPEG